VPRKLLLWRPAPGKWSIQEIVCHLRDMERVFVERFTKNGHQDRPQLWMMENERVAERLRYREAEVAAAVREFERLRGDTVALLRALPAAVWQRTGVHPKRGEVTIESLVKLLAEHDENHLVRIRELR
jgi:uncharacterized damage-inducible protein DinB